MKSQNGNLQSDHLILLSEPSGPAESRDGNFFERNWSSAWANFLVQEAGFYTLSSVQHFELKELDQYRFAYLPSSLPAKWVEENQTRLESYVQSGGTLIVEGPIANSLRCAGVRFSSKKKPLQSITSIQTRVAPHPLAESLLQMPFKTMGWEISSRASDSEVLFEMEGAAVFFKRSVGRGRVFVLGFDFGLLLVGLQQGIPVKGAYRLQKLFGTQSRVIEPEDLVLKASLLDNPIPWADLFERFLFKAVTQEAPAPRWWYFPDPYTGAVISTHDEEAIGFDPRLEAMCRQEKSEGIRSTLFVISDSKLRERWSNGSSLRHFNREGTEIGLHWNRFQKPKLKIRSSKFGMHEEPLAQQLGYLQKELGQPVELNRTHYLAMGTFYDEHFKSLAAEGVPFDSTYGPNQGGRGYLFGTGYPYYGLTWEGSLSGVLELPFLTQELWGGVALPFLERLIRESDENFHQVVTINFHPHYRVCEEEGRAVWLGALRFAKERKQWSPTAGEFYQFFKKRAQSPLRSRWTGTALEIFADSCQENSVLCFPSETLAGQSCLQIEVDGVPCESRALINGWMEERLVPIASGSHHVTVRYGN